VHFSLVGLFAIVVARAPAAQPCIRTDKDTVALTGKLERRTYPGRPNYESVKSGDEAETGFYLVLRTPACSLADTAAGAKKEVRLVQLVLDQAGYQRLRPRLGTTVTLRGTVFGSHTGHHHAPLLLNVASAVSDK
jgi:hypothetical protein